MIVERFVDFELEFSVVMARGVDGQFVHWGTIQNRHKHHILDLSFAPAQMGEVSPRKPSKLPERLRKSSIWWECCVSNFF